MTSHAYFGIESAPHPWKAVTTRTDVLVSGQFLDAATAWLESRRGRIAPRTLFDYGNYIKRLNKFFCDMRLPEITGDQVRAYQDARSVRAGAALINKELNVLMQMRQRINLPIEDYDPLQISKEYESPGRRLTDSEETILEHTFKAAAHHPLWATAAMASLLSMKSGLGPGEILSLQLHNCSLNPPSVEVPRRGAKRISRQRYITLNETAGLALGRLIELAHQKGSTQANHFLIPFKLRNHSYDPMQPAKGYRSGLNALLAIADIRCRRYDFRHHAVSVALDNPRVSRQAAISYFGWVSAKMFQRYHHADIETLNVVAAAMDKRKKDFHKNNA